MTRLVLVVVMLFSALAVAAANDAPQTTRETSQGQVDFAGFRSLADEVEAYRANRLVSLEQFWAMAREPNTIILDARSNEAYRIGHIDGAINLSFPDFTAQSLARTIEDPNTRILIYCNNNFENDAEPVVTKNIRVALNIQTFINLYDYGYRNVYELGDIVNFDDPSVRWVRAN
jgi:phage shock protein E